MSFGFSLRRLSQRRVDVKGETVPSLDAISQSAMISVRHFNLCGSIPRRALRCDSDVGWVESFDSAQGRLRPASSVADEKYRHQTWIPACAGMTEEKFDFKQRAKVGNLSLSLSYVFGSVRGSAQGKWRLAQSLRSNCREKGGHDSSVNRTL